MTTLWRRPGASRGSPTARRCSPPAPPIRARGHPVLQGREPTAVRSLQVPRRLQRHRPALRGRQAARRGGLLVRQPRPGHRPRGSAAGRPDRHRHAQDAPAMKVAATRGYGGEVVLYDRYTEDREAIGRRLSAERGLTLIPPYDHEDVIAGQGTAAKELIEEAGPLDMLVRPPRRRRFARRLGPGRRALSPGCRVFGVEPEAGNDGQQSFRSGAIVRIPVPSTIADGAQTPSSAIDLPDHPRAGRGHRHRVRRHAGRGHALLRRAHEDRGRAHRLPGGRRRPERDRPRRRKAGRYHHQRRQRGPEGAGGLPRRLIRQRNRAPPRDATRLLRNRADRSAAGEG